MARDPAATQARILEAATQEFAEHGFHGARYDRIAVRAHANKERIYNYFGDKDQLFTAVLEQHLVRLAEAHRIADAPTMAHHVGELFDFHRQHPELIRLLLWEALHFGPGSEVPAEEARAEHYRSRRDALQQALSGQEDGLDPGHVSFLLTSMVAWWFAVPHVARLHVEGEIDDDTVAERHRQLVVETAARLLSAESAANQPKR